MAIPRDFINDLVARTDIVELIDRRVPLKKAGKNHSACCPFHSEKSPSFTVNRDKQFYHCFGCGAHGNVIDFLMEYDRLDFVDAIEELAALFGLEVPREQGGRSKESIALNQDLYQLMAKASDYYLAQRQKHPERQVVQDYLAQRELSTEVIQRFEIGFAPNGWQNLAEIHHHNEQLQQKLITAGMLIEKDQGHAYDRFRERLMFPIRDRRGRVIGFGGRVLGDGTPKYLNSPETPIFHKGRELYGLYELKQAHRDPETIIIVEGYMDVVALAQFGVDYAVASLGTSTTSDQFQLLLRSAKQIICCYDGDRAGYEAAWRALETALPLLKPGDLVRFAFMPEGEDPDSLIRKIGQAAFEAQLQQAKSLEDFLFDNLNQQYGHDKGLFAQQAMQLIEKIQDILLQNLLLERLAYRLGMNDADDLKKKLGFKVSAKQPQSHNSLKGRGTPLRLAIALLVQQPSLGYGLQSLAALGHLQMQGIELLNELLAFTQNNRFTTAQLLEHFREDKYFTLLRKLAQWEHQIADENLELKLKEALLWLVDQCLAQRYEQLTQQATHNKEERIELQQLLAQLKNKAS